MGLYLILKFCAELGKGMMHMSPAWDLDLAERPLESGRYRKTALWRLLSPLPAEGDLCTEDLRHMSRVFFKPTLFSFGTDLSVNECTLI